MFKCEYCNAEFTTQRGVWAHWSCCKNYRLSKGLPEVNPNRVIYKFTDEDRKLGGLNVHKYRMENLLKGRTLEQYYLEEILTKNSNAPMYMIRAALYYFRGEKCELCGWNMKNIYSNTIPLEVHHINGKAENNPENLQILCPNCHSLTSTYKALNKQSCQEYLKHIGKI